MAIISELKELFGAWITAVAGAVDAVAARHVRSRQIVLREGEGNSYTVTMLPAQNRPVLPGCHFLSAMAGLIRRCRRIGRPRCVAAVSKFCCSPAM